MDGTNHQGSISTVIMLQEQEVASGTETEKDLLHRLGDRINNGCLVSIPLEFVIV